MTHEEIKALYGYKGNISLKDAIRNWPGKDDTVELYYWPEEFETEEMQRFKRLGMERGQRFKVLECHIGPSMSHLTLEKFPDESFDGRYFVRVDIVDFMEFYKRKYENAR